jgi:hypothetical protein
MTVLQQTQPAGKCKITSCFVRTRYSVSLQRYFGYKNLFIYSTLGHFDTILTFGQDHSMTATP